MLTDILVGIIILHLVAGFGFIMWKLNGKVNEDDSDEKSNF